MSRGRRLLAVFGFALFFSGQAYGEDGRLIPGYNGRPIAYRVYASGKVEIAFPPAEQNSSIIANRITGVNVSPSQQKIVYRQDNDLWLYNINNKTALRLTTVGKPVTKEWDSIEVSMPRWSSDESQFLYNILNGFTDNTKVRPASYGGQLYDLKTAKSTQSAVLPAKSRDISFTANGEYLLHLKDAIVRYESTTKKLTTVTSFKGQASSNENIEIGQEEISPDGRWLTLLKSDWTNHTSQLFKVELASGTVATITNIGQWAEYQWPKLSPSQSRIAYERKESTAGLPQSDLIVDGRPVYSFAGYRSFYWIDDSTIVLINESILTVVDANTGLVKSESSLKFGLGSK